MAVIGSIVIGMAVQTGNLTKGLGRGAKSIADFGSKAAAVVAPVARLGSLLGAVADAGIAAFVFRMADAIDKTGDAADRLGTTTAALSELRYAAKLTGSEIEDLDIGLTKMNLNIGKAAQAGSKDGSDAFSKIGLDAQKLAQMDPTEAFSAITSGIKGLGTESAKTAIAVEIFGKGGAKLLNTINAGPAALAKFGDEFRKFGGSVSETSRQQVAATMDALDRVNAAVGGLGSQLAVQLSPFVEAAASKLTGMATAGEGMGSRVGGAIEFVVNALGMAADVVQVLKLAFLATQAAVTIAIGHTVKALSGLGKGVESIINLIPGMHVSFTSTLDAIGDGILAAGKDLKDGFGAELAKPAWSEGLKSGFDAIKAKAAETARAVADSANKMKGSADDFQIISPAASAKAADAAIKRYAADAQAIFEKTRTPLEKYQEELAKIDRALKGGAIDDAIADKAAMASKADLVDQMKTGRAAAVEQGSKEARSAVLDFRAQGRVGGDPSKQVADNTRKSAVSGEQLVTLMREFIQGNKVVRHGGEALGKVGGYALSDALGIIN